MKHLQRRIEHLCGCIYLNKYDHTHNTNYESSLVQDQVHSVIEEQMLKQDNRSDYGIVVSWANDCQGQLMIIPFVPNGFSQRQYGFSLIVVVGAPNPPSIIELERGTKLLDVPNAHTDSVQWWRAFNKAWQRAVHILRAGRAVCVCVQQTQEC